jgi:hypothetical protein
MREMKVPDSRLSKRIHQPSTKPASRNKDQQRLRRLIVLARTQLLTDSAHMRIHVVPVSSYHMHDSTTSTYWSSANIQYGCLQYDVASLDC